MLLFYFKSFQLPTSFLSSSSFPPFEVELQIYLSMFFCCDMVLQLLKPDFQSSALSETTVAVWLCKTVHV